MTEFVGRCSYYAFSLVLGMYFGRADGLEQTRGVCGAPGRSKWLENEKVIFQWNFIKSPSEAGSSSKSVRGGFTDFFD